MRRWAVLLALAIPAMAQRASAEEIAPLGFFSKIAGVKFVVAASERFYSVCEVKIDDAARVECRHAWNGGTDTTVYRNDITVGETRLETFEKGLLSRSADSTNYYWIDTDGDVAIISRVTINGATSYGASRWVQLVDGDVAAAVRKALKYSKVGNRSELFARVSGNLQAYVGARIDLATALISVQQKRSASQQSELAASTEVVTSPEARPTGGVITRVPPGAGPRLALVIGNSAYGASLGGLANPSRDARLVADALRETGFEVELVLDANQRTFKQAIARLGGRLRANGASAIGLFYYAGHGIQSNGVNYLIPTDAALANEADLDLDGIPADAVLSQMQSAGAGTNIVVLDACRDMPLARTMRSGMRGLARMDAPTGSYVAYSTAPGQQAADGSGTNSPYAQAFAAEIRRPGVTIEAAFKSIRARVFQSTGGKQTPWDSSSLMNDFVFVR